MRLQLFTYIGFAALTFGLTSACAGGQTGDLSGEQDDDNTGEHASGGCEEHEQELASFDEATVAGTANELLAYAEGAFEAPLVWKEPREGQSWTAGPETGEGTLHIDVARGQKAYLLTYTPKPSNNGTEAAVLCPGPRLGVEAKVTVASDGGALAEQYDTRLRSEAAGVATLDIPLDLGNLSGSLEVTSSNPKAKLVQTRLEATLTSAGMTGSIAGMEQVDSGGTSSAMAAVIAVWPASEACQGANREGEGLGVGVEDEALGFTGAETLASVAAPTPLDVAWRDGSETTLTVDIMATGDGCFSVSPHPVEIGGGPNVVYPIKLALKSADGRLDGEYAGSILANGTGAARRVTATAYLDLPPDQLAATGFTGVVVPDGAHGLMVQVDSHLDGEETAGSIQLFAYTNPPCSTQAPEPMQTPGGGASVPGCPGQMRTPLEATAW
jgi:hypothetical protein